MAQINQSVGQIAAQSDDLAATVKGNIRDAAGVASQEVRISSSIAEDRLMFMAVRTCSHRRLPALQHVRKALPGMWRGAKITFALITVLQHLRLACAGSVPLHAFDCMRLEPCAARWLQAGARGEQLAGYVTEQGHVAALTMHDNTDKAAEMLTDAARKVRMRRCASRTTGSDASHWISAQLLLRAYT